MTARFRLPAGRTYNVRASELARDRQHTEVVCNILLLDNTVQAFRVNKHDQGQVLLDIVFKHLDLTERDYFGLQLADESTDNPRWLDPNKPIRKQLKRGSPHSLNLRVKFFVSDPNKLQEEYTRLPCPYNTAALLASYAVQSELGDYNHSENLPGYLSDYSFIPSQPQDFEKEIAKLHQQHIGLSPAEAEFNYLNTARTLELYGVELHYARVSLDQLHESRETLLGFNMVNYRACKNLWKACVEHHTFFRLDRPLPPQKNFFAHYFTLGSKFRYCGMDWEVVSRNSLSDDRLETQSLPSRSPPGTPNHVLPSPHSTRPRDEAIHLAEPAESYPGLSKSHCILACLVSWTGQGRSTGIIQGQGHGCERKKEWQHPFLPNGGIPHDNLVMIRMKPDENGRFGFNVKGGYDQKMPVIVSRVAPGTPADLCVPRLNEGDQVVLINGRDIAEHTHDQVVMFIKASCERHSGELVLLVRPNAVYDVVEEKLESEPDFQYIPEKSPLDGVHQDDNALRESMIQLAEGLITGTVLAQFDQLYRKKPGMTMSCARLPQNISKNRYRDISPYDATRVILKSNEDYINANYINMEIPSSTIINQYIACQGPLPNTCPDFWQMTWEQGSSMVVMLTTQVERGRVKCHQYWPEPSGSSSYGNFQITCHSEEGNPAYVFREMTLTNLEKEESRQLTQIQYIAWPDHGVPDDSSDFLDFVCLVRKKRAGREEPVVVHCSAGIGRTGVLITMETAMCLIECNQPVYPLDIVRTMRDQRAMMIQTPVSIILVFLCCRRIISYYLVVSLNIF
uniref:protein-tyrosine-phosphatase n=1 Tax=Anser brachyrhynchus TaxID=132585 RepID=A0A8B9CV40_9AVES